MGFIIKENTELVHCKLTDEGRRKISQGKFNPTKFSVGDSEINYEYYRDNNHDFEDSFVKSPIDRYRRIKHIVKANPEDTIDKYNIGIDLIEEREYIRDVEDKGFFNGDLYNHIIKTSTDFIKVKDFKIDISELNSDGNFILRIRKTQNYSNLSPEPEIGDYIVIKWNNPLSGSDSFGDGIINSDQINPILWYKIINITGTLSDNTIEITVDRELPNFNTQTPSNIIFSYGFILPSLDSMKYFYNSPYISDYWEQGVLDFEKTDNNPPLDSQIWNLNILHIDNIIGLNKNNIGKDILYSNPYAGLITYLSDISYNISNIGIIHFTNNNPLNIYGENFKEDIVINLPTILWHKNEDNKIGLRLESDNVLKESEQYGFEYYNLIDDFNNIVGLVFNDLKIILITDQELLYSLSYKSNRNWTLVEAKINFNLNTCFLDTSGFTTIYYGTLEVLGSLVNIPVPDDIDILSGIEVNNTNVTDFSLSIPFASNNNDFIWLAIPTGFPIRTRWYVNIFNRGDIGGIKNINGNLFPNPETKIINGTEYSIYISNYRTKAQTINFLL